MFPVIPFTRRVVRDFLKNQGIVLAGAVAYYLLLSLVPLFTLLLVGLTHIFDRERLLSTVASNLEFLVPGHTDAITEAIAGFLDNRHVIGVVVFAVLLFFSSMAFSVLQTAIATIFHRRVPPITRHAVVSALIPYFFVMALGAGLVLLTLLSGALEAIGRNSIHVLGRDLSLEPVTQAVLVLVGLCVSVGILTALYVVMPVGRVRYSRAVPGAVAATVLWEIVRRILVWYFANLSMVNVLYGSLATPVIVLLTLEAASIILLLGAQVIAELESAGDNAWTEHAPPADDKAPVVDAPPPPAG